MSNDRELTDALMWAEAINRERQGNIKRKANNTSTLKIALYIFCAAIFILVVIYIINRAYKIPDPPSILEEVNKMTNQIQASGVDGFSEGE